MSEHCTADFMEANLDCELPAGHDGDHQCMFTWPQTDFHQLAALSMGVVGGYLMYLRQKYEHAAAP